ncbi:pseudaminic acid synthase [bacterium SCSIO 12696]|uniref:pseudaminic acid synthase n=1 Tax=Porticoccus sp. W117 TaxID=3054777 RepID=UPI0021FC4F41|nr:pseudaminic acid synthase [Porticoccus sp. W117]MDM3872379.1 pseudaminic acid synthase [Porticoccus sp. W117]UTW46024.1 pseudaminic acid synthase [bacterium SCSIO 12696]
MSDYIEIDGRKIGRAFRPYVISELSANHNGDIERAFRIIEESKKAGADAVKLQSYTHETITMDCDSDEFLIRGGLWDGRTLYDLYKEAHMPWDWHKPLFEKARELDITMFSSPFDHTAVDMLENLGAPAYKIASFEAIDIPLIKYTAATGKPMIISTGMATKDEISEAIAAAKDGGCKELVVLHCVSGYPAPASDYNLLTIPDLEREFGVIAGLSDHTIDNTTAVASVALGACVIEKHVTLSRSGGGPDDSFSLEPRELKNLCDGARISWESLGRVNYDHKESEKGSLAFRRSLYFVQDVMPGEIITSTHVRSIRPGYGLPPKFYDQVMGKKVKALCKRGNPVKWDCFE